MGKTRRSRNERPRADTLALRTSSSVSFLHTSERSSVRGVFATTAYDIVPDGGRDCGALELAEREQQAFEQCTQLLRGALSGTQFSQVSVMPERSKVEQLERVSGGGEGGGENGRAVADRATQEKRQVIRKKAVQCLQHVNREQLLEASFDET